MDTNRSLESYPSRGEVDRWLDSIWELVDATECRQNCWLIKALPTIWAYVMHRDSSIFDFLRPACRNSSDTGNPRSLVRRLSLCTCRVTVQR